MEIKETKPFGIYSRQFEVNMQNIGKLVAKAPAEIMQQAQQENLIITGPQQWLYTGMDGNPEANFQLEIGFPVDENTKLKCTAIHQIDGIKCATTLQYGDWSNFPATYQKLIDEIYTAGYNLCGHSREVYHVVDFKNPANNITEIQMEIK